MLFHFLNFSPCAVCMFGHKTIYKVTNLKVHSKGRYFVLKKIPFQELQWTWTTKLFSCICDITNFKSRLQKFKWLGGWRTLGWALHVSKSKTGAGVFISLFSESFGCHFHFILHIQGAGHIIRISSKSWFISLIPFKKWNLYNVYIHSTQTDIFQVFISFNFDDYNWQLMKTPNSVSQKIRILLKTNTKKGFLEILANWKVWTWKVWACTALNT